MAPTLYHVPKTISSPIYQIIIELGLTDDRIKVETLSFKDLKSPEHLARNPMGTSPTLTDDRAGFAMWESGAVMSYILATYDTNY
jgi:glutathione S-transferase